MLFRSLEKEKLEQEKIANSLKKDKKQIAAEIKKKQQETSRIDAFTIIKTGHGKSIVTKLSNAR